MLMAADKAHASEISPAVWPIWVAVGRRDRGGFSASVSMRLKSWCSAPLSVVALTEGKDKDWAAYGLVFLYVKIFFLGSKM